MLGEPALIFVLSLYFLVILLVRITGWILGYDNNQKYKYHHSAFHDYHTSKTYISQQMEK